MPTFERLVDDDEPVTVPVSTPPTHPPPIVITKREPVPVKTIVMWIGVGVLIGFIAGRMSTRWV